MKLSITWPLWRTLSSGMGATNARQRSARTALTALRYTPHFGPAGGSTLPGVEGTVGLSRVCRTWRPFVPCWDGRLPPFLGLGRAPPRIRVIRQSHAAAWRGPVVLHEHDSRNTFWL